MVPYAKLCLKIIRGKECDPKGICSRYLSSNSVSESDCIDHATDFIQYNHLDEWMDCFSLKCKYGGISKHFLWHDCKCGLPTIICRTLPFLKHKYITRNNQSQLDIDLDDFFIQTEDYIWEHVLPKEGHAKYSWIDFIKGKPESGGEDPPEEVLSSSDIAWEEGETGRSFFGDTVYRESHTKVSCNNDQVVWRHTQGTLTQMRQVHN